MYLHVLIYFDLPYTLIYFVVPSDFGLLWSTLIFWSALIYLYISILLQFIVTFWSILIHLILIYFDLTSDFDLPSRFDLVWPTFRFRYTLIYPHLLIYIGTLIYLYILTHFGGMMYLDILIYYDLSHFDLLLSTFIFDLVWSTSTFRAFIYFHVSI